MVEKLENAGEKMVAAMQNNVSQSLALVFGISMMTWSAFNQMNSNYWSYFLTDICGLEPTLMGTVRSISAIGAWIFVIVAAIVSEKIWLRHGAYRSWFAIAPAATAVCLMLTWVNPVGLIGPAAASIWMIIFYMLGQFCVNFFQIAAAAIIPAISHTEADSALMSTRKSQGNMLVKVLFAIISLPCILLINSAVYGVSYDDAKGAGFAGFFIFALILAVWMVVMYWIFFKQLAGKDPTEPQCEAMYQAKKRGEKVEIPKDEVYQEKLTIFEIIKLWITNIPALIVLVAELGRFIAQTLVQGLAVYIFQYVYGDITMSAIFMTIVNIVGLCATFIAEPISKKFGIKVTYVSGVAIALICCLLCFVIGAVNMVVFTVLISGIFFGMNFQNATFLGMGSNAIRYGEWRDGKSPRSFIVSTYQWCPQISNAIAGWAMGTGLASIGYVKGMDPDPEMAQGFVNLIATIPSIFFGISLILLLVAFPLGKKKMEQINTDIAKRKADVEAIAEKEAKDEK